MSKRTACVVGLFLVLALGACSGQQTGREISSAKSLFGDKISTGQHSSSLVVPRQVTTPISATQHTFLPLNNGAAQPPPTQGAPTNIPSSLGPDPYGPPHALTAEEIQLTQQLFALINSDRAVRGLYPFVWNATLAAGARQHSWDMTNCGFSHTCPYGVNQCTRIADEGFSGFTDCGENIGMAGPYPTPWQGVYNIQESMMHEGPTGWHFIHLTSTTLHRVGVGVYVDQNGYIWFTEDMLS